MGSWQGKEPALTAGAVRDEQVRTLYRQSPWIVALNPVNAAIVAAVLWSSTRAALIVGWVVMTALVAAGRALLRHHYFAQGASPTGSWRRRYLAGAAASGLVWGSGTVLLYASGEHAADLILVFIVAGMTAGAAGTLAAYLPAVYAFIGPMLIPFSVRILSEGDGMHLAMGGLVIVYGGALVGTSINTNRAVTDAFRLRFENEALLAGLARAQTLLEEANHTLERRVEERSAELLRRDEALQEARRMESIGLLAGGVAHDFNNLLTVILGNTVLLLDDPSYVHVPDGPLDEIRKAAERAASLVSQLLASSRRQARQPRVLDLNVVVSETQRLLARLIGEHIELAVTLRPAPLLVEADPGQLEQVIVNLATNGRDAMPGGGTLSIETEAQEVTGGDGDLAALEPGRYVVLLVRDTGVGMDAETRRMALHPFFTTKEVGHGTGLGLATVNGIVEQSGGHVFIDSAPGRGSCFRVFLPRSDAPLAAEIVPVAPVPRRTATVLLVEDEVMVRNVIARALVGSGSTVLEAENGEQALERARHHDGPIDLLVTDVVMGRMGGAELAKHLRAKQPGLRVLFMSGYSRDAELPTATVEEGVDFLQKPFTSSALVDRVSRLLAVARPSSPGQLVPTPDPNPALRRS